MENYCGQCDIQETARLMQHCDRVIGGDTGPLHLAAGLGVATVGIVGPTSVDRTGARGGGTTHITPPNPCPAGPVKHPPARFPARIMKLACVIFRWEPYWN